jgi:hypothetical protein
VNTSAYLTAVKIGGIVALLCAVSALPKPAAAQSRATLQATATVVDTKAGFDGLRQAKSAADSWAAGRAITVNDVSTVAQVSTIYRPAGTHSQTAELVVNIDYLKN